MGLAFIPLYIRYLGIEVYGLIGIFTLLQVSLKLLDMGMSSTLSREMSRFMGGAMDVRSIRDLLRSIEIIALVTACLIAIGIWSVSDWLATEWLRAEKLPTLVVSQALNIMGIVIALRFMESVYVSSIIGLQRQVVYNVINSALSTLRWFGAVGILACVSPTIEMFFIWQGLISVLALFIFSWTTYGILPVSDHAARFSLPALKQISRFASGIVGITFLGLLLSQVDKILLSRLLNLGEYGYYTLAGVAAGGLYTLAVPIQLAFLPRINELHASGEHSQLIVAFHRAAQMITVIVGSAAAVIIIYAELILNIWTQDAELSERCAKLLAILVFGNLLNCLMLIPFQTQLSFGWTSLLLKLNIFSVIFIIPTFVFVTPRFGAEGAAWAWLILNVLYMLLGIHFMYRRILITEKWRWYIQDIFYPLSAAVTVAVIFAWFMPVHLSMWPQLVYLLTAIGLCLLASALGAQSMRSLIFNHLKKKTVQLEGNNRNE